jgi:DNA-binding MarR family transcriptional regulator
MNELPTKTKSTHYSRAKRVTCLLLQVAHLVEKRLEEALDKVELSGPKFGALSKLMEADEPLTLSELAEQMTCVRSNITQLVDRLEADGLVRREDDPNDRRGVRASITPLGRERYTAGLQRIEEVQEASMGKALSELDGEALQRVLEALK